MNKLKRFSDIATMEMVVEPTYDDVLNSEIELKGKWNRDFFKNNNPIVLELGCGKGEYAVQLGKKYPEKNFIGIDVKGARIWFGANEVREKNILNVGFIRSKIEFIDKFFAENEIDEIWLTFSDPQPKKPRKRLSSTRFVEMYKKFLRPGGAVHIKTDSDLLFESTLEEINEQNYECQMKTWDLYNELSGLDVSTQEILSIKTHYEELFSAKGFTIKYAKFTVH